MEFLKNNVLSLIILAIIVIILMRSCGGHSDQVIPPPIITTIKDTVWVHTDSTIYNEPQIMESVPYPVDRITKEYLADTSYGTLVKQYTSLIDKYLATNISLDSIRIDSIGYVRIYDSVSKNMIAGRAVTYNLKYPTIKETITKTITVPEKKRGQLYIGVGTVMKPEDFNTSVPNNTPFIMQPFAGLMYKTKQDYMIGVNAGVDKTGAAQYGVSTYFKIRLKKN